MLKHLKKAFTFSIGSIVGLLISIISLPIITRMISPEEYGIVSVFISIAAIFNTLALGGFDQGFIRYFNRMPPKKLLQVCMSFSFILLVISTILIFAFDEYLSSLIGINNSYMFLLFIYIVALVLFRYANLILRMEEMGIKYSIVEAVRKAGDFLIVLGLFVVISPTHVNYIIGYIISLYLASCISFLFSIKFWKKKYHGKSIDTSETISISKNKKEIISYSIPFLFSNLILVLFQALDKIILSYWVQPKEVGVYSASMKMVLLLSVIQYVFSLYWTSFYLKRYEKKPEETVVFAKVTKIIFSLMILLMLFVILTRDYLVLFLGSEYQSNPELIAILVFIPFFVTITEATSIGINIKMKTKYHTLVMVVVILFFIFVSSVLTSLYGVNGMAIAMTVSYLLFFALKTFISQSLYRIELNYRQIASLITLLLLWLLLIMLINSVIIDISISILIITLLIKFYKDEYHQIFQAIKR